MGSFFVKIVEVIPRIRTAASLVGLVVAIGAYVAVSSFAPDNPRAQLSAGAIGVTIIIFGQIFYLLRLIPESQRAFLILGMFFMFTVFVSGLAALTAHFINELNIENLSIQSADEPSPPNTADDLLVNWSHKGRDASLKLRLQDTISGKRSGEVQITSTADKATIPNDIANPLWGNPDLDRKIYVNIEMYGDGFSKLFGPFLIRPALEIFYYLEKNEARIYSVVGNTRVNHNFEVRCIAWPTKANINHPEPKSITIYVINGGGSGRYPSGFYPQPETLKCVYMGSYPISLVKYKPGILNH
ncbi:MAG: hypothetical protein RLY71_2575 [Pseudomonadota bacterium]|jgi:hypothetical protein